MEPYFSQNYAPMNVPHHMKKQQLFIDARDYLSDIVSNNNKLQFTVMMSNGKHTVKKQVPNGYNQYGNPIYKNVIDTSATWSDSLSIPPYDYVSEVEILGISLPKIEDEIYFIVEIPEFDNVLDSSDNRGSHDSFAVVYYDSTIQEIGSAKPMKGKDFSRKVCKFNPPIQSLNRFTIQFKKYGGNIITLENIGGQDNLKYCNLLLEFTIKE
tara:strand:- start:2666 stop:3298 length:633 start_codon:yes stop_codon:yes gene_type:complete